MFHRKPLLLLNVVVVVGLLLAACAPAATTPTPEVKVVEATKIVESVTVATPTAAPPPPEAADTTKRLRLNMGPGDIPTIDPALATDLSSISIIEEVGVGLTRQNVTTTAIEPGMATDWKVSDDGLTYTFNLRTDVPWVKWDDAKGEVVKVQDCGDPAKDRMVTAKDFEYGILRTLAPATASDYAYVLAFAIDGADAYNSGDVTDAATVGVKAIDDKTLEIKFKDPAVYNANIAGMWVSQAQPSWLIDGDDCTEARGDRWTETGFHQGFGPYAMKEWVHDSSITLVKNPFWPGSETVPQAKIDEINWVMLDTSPAFAEFEAGNLDNAGVPLSELDRVKVDPTYSKMLERNPTLGTEFYSFNTQKAPTDDARVRKALSLAIDRQSLVDSVNKGSGEVAQWFCRPGLTGCPTMESHPDLGVKYDPVKAKALLDEYLKEKGLTADQLNLTLMFNTSEAHQKRAEAVQQMWKETLGVNVQLANQEWKVFLKQRRDGLDNVYRSSWIQDYPDANNFPREVFGEGGGAYSDVVDWQSDKFDELVIAAAKETDPVKRVQMYADADKMLVEEDAVIAPLYWYASYETFQPYVVHPPSITGQDHLEFWDIQQ